MAITLDELNARVTITVPEFSELVGVSSWSTYEAIKSGTFPLPTIRVGRRVVIPAAPARAKLGIEADRSSTPGPSAA